MALAEEEEKKKQSHATFEHYVLCRGRGIRGLDVWSSYLLHFGLLELLESELDLVCFHLRLDLLLNGKQYVIVMN